MSSESAGRPDPNSSKGNAELTPRPAIYAKDLTKVYSLFARPQDRFWQMFRLQRKKLYTEIPAVTDVSIELPRGTTLGIVGRNGSGKSTLLGMICGTIEPTRGTLEVSGHLAPLLSLGAGFNRDFTGRENVFMNASILGMSDREIHSRLDSIVEFSDIGQFFDLPVKSYSAGMYSRLAFAIAINSDPDILVIDEILAVGDEAFSRKCFGRIEELKRNGSTIVFVSHSADLVMDLCDEAILMEAGEQLLTADPRTVISRYKRLVHAPLAQVESIREETRVIDAEIRSEKSRPKTPDAAGKVVSETEVSAPVYFEMGEQALFDPQLVPESTVEFPPQGAKIQKPRTLGVEDKPVNVLKRGEGYAFCYEVAFTESLETVRFGMMVKSITGLELGGQVSHPDGEGFEQVEPGSIAVVRFRFQAALAPGAYFLNAGVLAYRDGEERYVHRILDALMIRILPEPRGLITGRMDFSVPDAPPAEIVFG